MIAAKLTQRIPRWLAIASAVVLSFLVAIVWRNGQEKIAAAEAAKVAAGAAEAAAGASSRSSLPAGFDVSTEMQQQRLALINKLINQGVFQKIEKPRQLPYLWVRPAFYALDFDMKQKFSNVVYAYFKADAPGLQLLVLYDSRTGKQVGKFSETAGGLELD